MNNEARQEGTSVRTDRNGLGISQTISVKYILHHVPNLHLPHHPTVAKARIGADKH